jgi:hypothetical protein
VDADLDTLATALYVHTDDWLKDNPHRIPWRPKVGFTGSWYLSGVDFDRW